MTSARVKAAVAVLAVLCVAVVAVASATQGAHRHGAAPAPSCTGSAETFGNMTLDLGPCSTYGWSDMVIQNATLASKQVLPLIKTAYDYHLVYLDNSTRLAGVMYAVLNVTGSQQVTGNWTSGYSISYSGNRLLNITVLHVIGSVYQVSHVSSYPLPSRNTSLAYSAQQEQAIQVALANSTVTSLMGTKPYYVELAAPTGGPSGPTFVVQFYQVDGPGTIGAFIDVGLDKVTGSFTLQRVTGDCSATGMVITDPWGAVSSCSDVLASSR